MGALLACIATSFRGSPQERLISERSISESMGSIGSGCTTALTLEDFFKGERTRSIDRSDPQGKSVEPGGTRFYGWESEGRLSPATIT